MDFKEELLQKTELVNNIIKGFYPKEEGLQKIIFEAMNYSIEAGGKRLRPIFMMEVAKLFNGFNKDIEPFMAALEMIHTYSLVHDDLPAMDNDDYRHGKLSSHKKFGEDNAILAGDALLSDAFKLIADSKCIDDKTKVILIRELSDAIGSKGMVRGQFYDLRNEKGNNDYHILDINYLKTSKLLSIPFIFAAYIAKKDYKLEKFLEISDDLGLAFQIQDDILDYEGDFETIGKTPLKDVNSNKQTYVNQFGLEDAKLKVITLFKNIYNSIEEILDLNKTYLCELVDLIKNRRK